MEKKYMVVGFGTSKKTGKPYSRAYLLKSDKAGTFAFLDRNDSYYTEDIRPVGTMIIVKLVEG
jgi:hypothetical protein